MSKGTVVVNGGSRGIGRATVRKLAADGYDVCFSYYSRADAAAELAGEITAGGGKCLAVKADSSVEDEVIALFRTAESELGPIVALVNNGAINRKPGPVADLSVEDLTRTMAVNVNGFFLCAREAIRRMATSRGGKGGAIVNVSSRGSVHGSPHDWVDYAASKGAVDTMTVGLAREVGPDGIRVNCVRPGPIATEMHDIAGGASRLEKRKQLIPLGRVGEPEEVAAAIVWLLSDDASFVSGAIVDVGGGRI